MPEFRYPEKFSSGRLPGTTLQRTLKWFVVVESNVALLYMLIISLFKIVCITGYPIPWLSYIIIDVIFVVPNPGTNSGPISMVSELVLVIRYNWLFTLSTQKSPGCVAANEKI